MHRLSPPAPEEAVTSLEGHLSRPLPPGLRIFLTRNNGGTLFRGALRIRAASELAIASESAPQVVLFADSSGTAWAWAGDGRGGFVFGTWDGGRLLPLHTTFEGWLAGTIAVLETRVTRTEDRASLRFSADESDPLQLVQAGERELEAGHPELARPFFHRAVELRSDLVHGWQRLGEAVAVVDRSAARTAWLTAFRQVRLPLPFPGAACVDPDILRPLSAAFINAESWEKELTRFLEEQVADVFRDEEAALFVAAGKHLARSQVRRGRRRLARQTLSDLLARCRGTSWGQVPWTALLELAKLELELGNHNEAEALLRRVRRDGPSEHQGAAHLVLARIATERQEPWAEEILVDASRAGVGDADGVRLACLRVERALRLDRVDEAQRWLGAARESATRTAGRSLQALVCLASGDVQRVQGDLAAARSDYKKGLGHLGNQGDPQLRTRIMVRFGDLALTSRDRAGAAELYRQAVDTYGMLELPVREGWALLRLAQVVPERGHLLTRARERFAEADLAAGVAAVDAVSGDAGASLLWHLDRSTAHARARYDAQRSRPPWERADADRPERRLGAHRLAISACDETVVMALADEMGRTLKAMSKGRLRALDPPVLRYIAAADLLAGHRSYRAAQILLTHVLEPHVEGHARRALQGAIARSPNAALVDGLLTCIEEPTRFPSNSVAEAAEILGLRREQHAVEALTQLSLRSANPIARRAAITALGRIGDRSIVDNLLGALDETALAERAALALLMLGDRRGVDFHARALTEGRRDLSGSPGEIVGRYGGPSHLLLLMTAAEGQDETALGALQGLGLMGDPRGVATLLDALHSRNRQVVEVANGALHILTGHGEEMDVPGSRTRWQVWWEQNEHRFTPGLRYRDGELLGPHGFLERMDAFDPWTRRTAYDELVITSGCQLPFDSDGPWRVQRAHLRAWRHWVRTEGRDLTPGHWFLDGQQIG